MITFFRKSKRPPAAAGPNPHLTVGSSFTIVGIFILLTVTAIVILVPLAWLLSSSLKTQQELAANTWGPPITWQFINYVKAWQGSRLGTYMSNSVYVTALSIAITLVASTPIAFVVSRFKFRLRNPLYYLMIAGMMIPIHSAVIPLYILVNDLGMENSRTTLALIYGAFRIPISVFILEGFMIGIPKEIEESACIDGCSTWRLFTHITVPLSRDGMVTISILTVLATWNELLISMLFLSDPKFKTLPIGLMGFLTEFQSEYTQLAAGIMIAIMPSVFFYILMQERIEKGMTVGAVKG